MDMMESSSSEPKANAWQSKGGGPPGGSQSIEFVGEERKNPPGSLRQTGPNPSGSDPHESSMSVKQVLLTSEVYRGCLNHALSTEEEEVMGLLVGWQDVERKLVVFTDSIILKRMDKRKDRVEISSVQLAAAAEAAEKLSDQRAVELPSGGGADGGGRAEFLIGAGERGSELVQAFQLAKSKDIGVLGWYHSHPHITPHPSHVDVRTQFQYQNFDRAFVGLIFSVFNDDKRGGGLLPYIAFQSFEEPLVIDGEVMEGVPSGNIAHRLLPVAVMPAVGLPPVPTAVSAKTGKTAKARSSPVTEAPGEESAALQHLSGRTLRNMEGLGQLMLEESKEALAASLADESLTLTAQMHNGAEHAQAMCRLLHFHVDPLAQQLTHRRQRLLSSHTHHPNGAR